MRIAFISDVHANLEALETVLKHIDDNGKVDAIYFLGDAVGYGPDPDACISLIQSVADVSVAGNHDHGLLGITDITAFNPLAAEALQWSEDKISEQNLEVLKSWQLTNYLADESIFMVHASPDVPEKWQYVISVRNMEMAFKSFTGRICLVGHSHIPFVTELNKAGQMIPYGKGPGRVQFADAARYVVNAGSVGQPRDQDPRAGYIIIDDEGIEVVRVEYDFEATARRMVDLDLHVALSERIKYGF